MKQIITEEQKLKLKNILAENFLSKTANLSLKELSELSGVNIEVCKENGLKVTRITTEEL